MLLIAIGWLAACGPVNPDTPQNPGGAVNPGGSVNPGNPSGPPSPPQVEYYCKAELPDVQVFSRGASNVTFFLETNIEEFHIAVSEPWCTGLLQDGNTDKQKKLVVRVQEYDARKEDGSYSCSPPRFATLRISGGGAFDHSVTVVQNTHVEFAVPSLPYENNDFVLHVTGDDTTVDLPVTTNCYSWSARSNASWIQVSRKDSATLTVKTSARSYGATRQGLITLFDEADNRNNFTFIVAESEASLSGNDYDYGEGSEWD